MKKTYKVLLAILLLLIIIRLILPSVILHYLNRSLAGMKGFYGKIEKIDLSLYRGAYVIKNMFINKLDSTSKDQTEFFKSPHIDLAIEWKALVHGHLVGKMVFESPELIFTKDNTELEAVKNDSTNFKNLLRRLMPLRVNRFEIINGSIHYIDNSSKPKVDISLEQTHILAHNLTNITPGKDELPSSIAGTASVYEGALDFNIKLNALAHYPTFYLNAELKHTNLARLNDFLKAYGNFTVNKGKLSIFTEMAAKDGKFKGYVKPLIDSLEVVGPQDRHDSFLQKIWESIVGTAGTVFKNQKKDLFATKIPIEGNLKNPHVKTLYAIWEVLRNAFIQALMPQIDNDININSVRTIKTPDKVKSSTRKKAGN